MKYQIDDVIRLNPITSKTECTLEGRIGLWTIIDAAVVRANVYVLLEHNTYGDETSLVLAKIPSKPKWLVLYERDWVTKMKEVFYFPSEYERGTTYDDIVTALFDEDIIQNKEECVIISDEDLNYEVK